MSEDGYKKLMAELKELETVERPKISAAIAEARDKGDLSENAEYDAAKEAQGMLEMKINKLKTIIADAKIIDESKLKTDSVQILNKVELKNVKNGMKMTYTIVSESEANLKEGRRQIIMPLMFWATHVLQWPVQREARPRGGAKLIKPVPVRIVVCNSTT